MLKNLLILFRKEGAKMNDEREKRLKELREQRKKIDAEIKTLTHREVKVGRCKFHLESKPCRGYEWIVTYTSRCEGHEHEERNKRLIANHDKRKAIAQILDVINDLQALHDELLKED